MASLARKIQKKISVNRISTSTAAKKAPMGMVTRKENPHTGMMQDYHYTKGWR